MGTAPSAELLAKWNQREGALIATDPDRVPPLALPPEAEHAILGGLDRGEWGRVGGEAARTAPPRENGGNQDIKNLSKGTRVFRASSRTRQLKLSQLSSRLKKRSDPVGETSGMWTGAGVGCFRKSACVIGRCWKRSARIMRRGVALVQPC